LKGTIDFLCGSSGAKGAEKEDVMLLGDKVQNKTVPLLLCAEEDVEGEHGASVGRIDDELMFYMLSRGLDEQTAIDLLARSKISSVISKIDDEQTVKRLDSELLWGESNE
jgi:Fe-S cluster assembly scaffold protein SufB